MAGDDSEKSEAPTPKKLEDARERGDVPLSRDFANFVVFFGLTLSLYFWSDAIAKQMVGLFIKSFGEAAFRVQKTEQAVLVLSDVGVAVFGLIGPIFAAVFLFGVIAYMSQIGILFTTHKIMPSFEKINPAKGFARIFSKETAVDFIKSLIKLFALGLILFFLFRGDLQRLMQLGQEDLGSILIYIIESLSKLMMAFLIFIGVLGTADFAYQRWSYHERQKMSFREVKDEVKNREGDPTIKARVRQIQRELMKARMMADVPKADVVVANPTHVAVAIQYRRGEMGAPRVVAKGAGHIAVKIKELAIKNEIPVLEKKELARFLYFNVEIGHFIPESLYSAVAEVLAYVYRIKQKYKSLGFIPKIFEESAGG